MNYRDSVAAVPAVIVLAILVINRDAIGQDSPPDRLVVKVYRVADLVLPTPNYEFKGVRMPGMDTSGEARAGSAHGYGGGMGGMGMGGGGVGGTGGGMFQVADHVGDQMGMGGTGMGGMGISLPTTGTRSFRFTLADLTKAITSTVEPDAWEQRGGAGGITVLGAMLIIHQTPEIHVQITQFLETLRTEGGAVRSVSITAYWLLMDGLLNVAPDGRLRGDRAQIEKMAAQFGSRGQITCFDGQTVHIIAGNTKTSVSTVIPVVGQSDEVSDGDLYVSDSRRHGADDKLDDDELPTVPMHVLAQIGAGGAAMAGTHSKDVAYQPVTRTLNFGALLQVTPIVIPHSRSIVLDLQSTVIVPSSRPPEKIEYPGVLPLDRLDVVSQQFMTTLRMPLDTPVVVGGSTLEPMGNADTKKQLYLVVIATLNDN